MSVVSLKNILIHILQEHDFDAYDKDGLLFGEKDGQLLTVGFYDQATINDVRSHSDKVRDIEAAHIICVLEAGPEVEQAVAENGLVLWRRPDLEAEIGRALVSHISDGGVGHFSDLLEAGRQRGAKDMGQLPVVLDDLGTGVEPRVVSSRLSLDDVKEISSKTVKGFKHELEFVPHYLYHYLCIFEGRDGEEKKTQGRVAVNALTGKAAEWAQEPGYTGETRGALVHLEPKIDVKAAKDIALKHVIETNTESKEVLTEKEHATIIEKTSFRPREEDIVLERATLVMVPVWCVEGTHGVMILDGFTRKVISEDYYLEGPRKD